MSYDTESKSRNADFISIAREGNPSPSAPQALSPPERSDATLLHNLRRQPRPLFIICGEAATTTLGAKGPVKLKNPPDAGRSILRTFSFTTLLHNLPPTGGHNPRGAAPSTLTPKGRVKKISKTLLTHRAIHGIIIPVAARAAAPRSSSSKTFQKNA